MVMRLAFLLCALPCQSAYSPVFADDFLRPDGPIGSNYSTGMSGTPPLNILNYSVCSNTQSLAVYTRQQPATQHRLSYTFTPHSVEGFETYAIAYNGPSLPPTELPNVWTVGCDGGYSQTCTPTIRTGDGNEVKRGDPVQMQVGETYIMRAEFNKPVDSNNYSVFWSVSLNSTGEGLAQLDWAGAAKGVSWYGLLVGRGSAEASCASHLRLERRALS
jgi:hypothetical protein